MENQVAVYEAMPLSAPQIQAQVNLIQEVMKAVMKDGEHYGKIPGCGDKPSLLKPGAEKLMFTFRLVADPEVEVFELYHPTVQGHREYRVKVKISSLNGTYMGGGIGSCSTMENKYRFRGGEKIPTDQPVPTEYWNLKNDGKLAEAKQLIGGEGYGVGKDENKKWVICEIGEKMEHDNPADFYNTCEKMAKKRALVDATLTVTAASDIFTQDIEELVDNGVMKPAPESKQPPVKAPQKKAPAAKEPEENVATVKVLSVASKSDKTKEGKPYTVFTIFDEADVKYGTFSAKFADLAQTAKESGELVNITFTVGQYGNKITNLELSPVAQ
jgi:ribosomal protein L12E/L44/L45/RPP1/RPP2